MKQQIEKLLERALQQLQLEGYLTGMPAFIQIDATKNKQHGDFASNVALVLAKPMQKNPRDIAKRIVEVFPATDFIEKIELAGPGFINFFLTPNALNDVVKEVLTEKSTFGKSKMGRDKKVLVEFVSSNPTGPLHVGHGRHAVFGDVIANLLDTIGFKTFREYYVNDAGRQMNILTVSVWVRYLNLAGVPFPFPANGYQGDYITDFAAEIYRREPKTFVVKPSDLTDLPPDEPAGGDKEIYIDAVIERAKKLLGKHYETIFDLTLEHIVNNIRTDLSEFGVHYDNWFSERELVATDCVSRVLSQLQTNDQTYEREGALWFRSTNFADEKDRVLIRSNGERTYFANDVAYHLNKFERDFDIAIDIFGSDHHGYVPRMKAAMEALGVNPERLLYLLLQFVMLYRAGVQASMSTRGGKFVTLRELREEVGNDAARFFYVMRKGEQHLDFDLDLAKAQSNENPVYYVQYAHARICSVFRQLEERGLQYDENEGLANLDLLTEDAEADLAHSLSRYREVIVSAALQYEPHQLTNYLRELATNFHSYYNSHQFLVEDSRLRNARLALISAVKQLLVNGFSILGINAPTTM